ncbi:glycine cleavage system protein GcvH [Candidatus Bathyarchaeota archaeon]|nr:glycine cleavage system protein GcvH [Candidatus Bathyarchaeota archaeon]
MNIPEDLKYTVTDEWIKIDGEGIASIGITDFAQEELTDIVYITDFPEIGDHVEKGSSLAVIESVKTVADVVSPFTGIITEINSVLEGKPEMLNEDPYNAWIIKIKVDDQGAFTQLLDPEQYRKKLSEDS